MSLRPQPRDIRRDREALIHAQHRQGTGAGPDELIGQITNPGRVPVQAQHGAMMQAQLSGCAVVACKV